MKQFPIKGKLFGLLASAVISMSATAQDDEVKLVIHNHIGGDPVEISVYDVRKVTFQDDHFTMVYEEGVGPDQQFLYEDVRKISFKNLVTGIENVQEETNEGVTIKRNGSLITVSGISGKAHLGMFDISGRPVMNRTISGETEISTDGLSSGVYILRVNNKTFKFSKI